MCITQQWHFASLLVWASSRSIPCCGAPHSYPLELSPHSQHHSPSWVCSSNPTFQHSAPVCTSGPQWLGHAELWPDHLCRPHSLLPATDWLLHCSLSHQISPSAPASLPAASPDAGNLFSPSAPLPRPGSQVTSHFICSSFSLLLSFVLPAYVGIFLVLLGA